MNDEITYKFKKSLDDGCEIWYTSCSCGGRFAWVTPTIHGSFIMYGCVCHNNPPEKGKDY